MNIEVMRSTLHESEAGRITFGEVVGALLGAGVESYFVDLVRGEDTFYMPNGESHVEVMAAHPTAIAEEFSGAGVVAAIRAAQADEVRYPEFLRRAKLAGTVAYWAFLAGKKVIYFGRKGEFHVEEFPRAAS